MPLEGEALEADDDERRRWRQQRLAQSSGSDSELRSLWIFPLPTGLYRIEVGCAAIPDAVFSQEVQVRDANRPMRLLPVKLEDHLRRVRLSVVAGDGQSGIEGSARVVGSTNGSGGSRAISNGSAVLWLDRPRPVEVQVAGYSLCTIADVFADTVVTVEKK